MIGFYPRRTVIRNHTITCVLPAYNAAKTLEKTLAQLPAGVVDHLILVDDGSTDETVALAQALARTYPLRIIQHDRNRGYGANQKTCYRAALETKAEAIIMLHPDHQYEPRLIGALAEMVLSGVYDFVLGSRMLSPGPLKGGMPVYKFVANRILTVLENALTGLRLSEYHTGYRAYHRRVLEKIDFAGLSDDFVFDNQLIVAAHTAGLRFGEISVPAHYFEDASSISFRRSLVYGLGVLRTSLRGFWSRWS